MPARNVAGYGGPAAEFHVCCELVSATTPDRISRGLTAAWRASSPQTPDPLTRLAAAEVRDDAPMRQNRRLMFSVPVWRNW